MRGVWGPKFAADASADGCGFGMVCDGDARVTAKLHRACIGLETQATGVLTNRAMRVYTFTVAVFAAAGFHTWPIEMRSSFLRPP
jgi:hypothetical protein